MKKLAVTVAVVAAVLIGPAAGVASANAPAKHACQQLAEAYLYHSSHPQGSREYAQTLIGWYDGMDCDHLPWTEV